MQDPVFFLYILIALAAAFLLLAVYAAVPAYLARRLGIRVEHVSIGILPVFKFQLGGIEWHIGSLPIAARAKYYGDEGVFGLRPEEWPSNRDQDEEPAEEAPDEDEEADSDADQNEPEAEEPPPEDSFVAASPAARTLVLAAGPLLVLAIGMGLLWASTLAAGPRPVAVNRESLPPVFGGRTDPVEPWRNFPSFAGRVLLPQDALAADVGTPVEPIESTVFAAESVIKLMFFMEPAQGFAGYLSWAVMLVRSCEVSPSYALATFGLFACLIGVLNLLPLPIFNGGMILLGVLEATFGTRLPRRAIAAAVIVGFLWFAVIALQVVLADVDRFG